MISPVPSTLVSLVKLGARCRKHPCWVANIYPVTHDLIGIEYLPHKIGRMFVGQLKVKGISTPIQIIAFLWILYTNRSRNFRSADTEVSCRRCSMFEEIDGSHHDLFDSSNTRRKLVASHWFADETLQLSSTHECAAHVWTPGKHGNIYLIYIYIHIYNKHSLAKLYRTLWV